jgi:hypothetical protein
MAKFMSYLIQNGVIDGVKFEGGISEEITDEKVIEILSNNRLAEKIRDNQKAVEQAEINVAEFNLPDKVEENQDVNTMPYNDVKALAASLGLSVAGKSDELRARVISYQEGIAELEANSETIKE